MTVTYDSQSGSAISSGSTTTGGSISSSPGTPTLSGYTFTGWFTAASGGSAITFPYVHGQTSDFTLYAQWTLTTCANGGACVVGNTGPGGGIVFYVHASGTFKCGVAFTSTCKYLEVAPSGWNTGADPTKLWAVTLYQESDSTITNNLSAYNNALGIGLGYKNSVAIVGQGNDTTTAAGAARAYAGGSQSDWYLPTTAELNLLCQWARNVVQSVTTQCTGGDLNTGTGASGGFSAVSYWSSSEGDADIAWLQSFSTGSQGGSIKASEFSVRPIRAFG